MGTETQKVISANDYKQGASTVAVNELRHQTLNDRANNNIDVPSSGIYSEVRYYTGDAIT